MLSERNMTVRKLLALVLAVGVFSILSIQALASDGERKGFEVEAGIGVGMTRITQNYSQAGNNFTLATDLGLGYAVSEQTMLFLAHKVNWFEEGTINGSTTFSAALSCLAFKFYAKPETQSGYLTTGLGLASLWDPFSASPQFKTGFGFFAGFGHDFGKVGGIEFDFMYGQVGPIQIPTRTLAVRFLLVS